ncbi:lipoxygenase homology domain-containing protein 1-like, partial [Lontra canadensis]|uniref:lipoxygenase homology domain-containing protein 1-like n=1 Tax=Lontra canadensis TaxID=76717 RepID=UPI0013F2F29E
MCVAEMPETSYLGLPHQSEHMLLETWLTNSSAAKREKRSQCGDKFGSRRKKVFHILAMLLLGSPNFISHSFARLFPKGDWKVTIVTGDLENAGTTATVSLYVYGEATCSGPIILGSGKYQLFNPNSADIFKINLKDIGEIYKIRIGHDNSGKDPAWYLEEIRLENIDTCEVYCLAVDSWIAENENGGDLWKEVPMARTNKASLPVVVYEIYMYTGRKPGAETGSNVVINLIGTRGDSGNRRLHQSQNNTVKFRRGQKLRSRKPIREWPGGAPDATRRFGRSQRAGIRSAPSSKEAFTNFHLPSGTF